MFPDLFRDDVFRIETGRLWLRWPTARDGESIQRLAGDPSVAEMTARIPMPLDRVAVDEFIVTSRAANAAGTGLTLALAERARPSRAIGVVAITPEAADGGAHLGYWLGRPYWGAGLMGEATAALVHAWFAWTDADSLGSSVRIGNLASRRVLERAGFVSTGRGLLHCPARGGEVEVERFRLDRARWLGDPPTLIAAE
jgi:RimJ/RimL family protein N-acetyltransferase